MRDVGGLGRPGRDGPGPRGDDHGRPVTRPFFLGFAVVEQFLEPRVVDIAFVGRFNQVDKSGVDRLDPGVVLAQQVSELGEAERGAGGVAGNDSHRSVGRFAWSMGIIRARHG